MLELSLTLANVSSMKKFFQKRRLQKRSFQHILVRIPCWDLDLLPWFSTLSFVCSQITHPTIHNLWQLVRVCEIRSWYVDWFEMSLQCGMIINIVLLFIKVARSFYTSSLPWSSMLFGSNSRATCQTLAICLCYFQNMKGYAQTRP